MKYEYDVFLSYNSMGGVAEWVENHFFGMLNEALEAESRSPPSGTKRIFNFKRQESGTIWPDNLKHAFARSRVVVAIWTPPYFEQPWCLSEWRSICARAKHCGVGLNTLFFPVRYGDGDHYPAEAKKQIWDDFQQYAHKHKSFRDNGKFIDFDEKVKKLAREIDSCLAKDVKWSADFPILEQPASEKPSFPIPLI